MAGRLRAFQGSSEARSSPSSAGAGGGSSPLWAGPWCRRYSAASPGRRIRPPPGAGAPCGPEAGSRFQGQEPLPGHHAVVRDRLPAEGDDRQIGLDLAQPFQDLRRADEEQPRPAGRKDVIDLGRRAGVIQRDAHRADQADGGVQGEVAGAVEPDDGDSFSGPDAQRGQRLRRRQDLAPHLVRAPRDHLPLAQYQSSSSGRVLLPRRKRICSWTVRSERCMKLDRRRTPGSGQELAPVERIGTQQPVDVVALEAHCAR